jgi:hypothetical protein
MENLTETEIASDWIIKAINSSNNRFHVEACDKLISLFEVRYPLAKDHVNNLMMILLEKQNSIYYF